MTQLFKPLRLSARPSAGLLVLRLVVGLAFVFHGYGKIQNPFGRVEREDEWPPAAPDTSAATRGEKVRAGEGVRPNRPMMTVGWPPGSSTSGSSRY